MLNKKFMTRLLGDDVRKKIITQNSKSIESKDLKLKQYATYVVDKYNNDRDEAFIALKDANYGYSPLEILAYVSKDGSVKTAFFEFNIVSHFLKVKDHDKAVEVVMCILAELVNENKKDIASFDIDKIDAHLKKLEEDYRKQQEEIAKQLAEKKQAEEKQKENDEEIHKEAN